MSTIEQGLQPRTSRPAPVRAGPVPVPVLFSRQVPARPLARKLRWRQLVIGGGDSREYGPSQRCCQFSTGADDIETPIVHDLHHLSVGAQCRDVESRRGFGIVCKPSPRAPRSGAQGQSTSLVLQSPLPLSHSPDPSPCFLLVPTPFVLHMEVIKEIPCLV